MQPFPALAVGLSSPELCLVRYSFSRQVQQGNVVLLRRRVVLRVEGELATGQLTAAAAAVPQTAQANAGHWAAVHSIKGGGRKQLKV